jgi:RNA polymerase sigma factor for flagellar operon FliA
MSQTAYTPEPWTRPTEEYIPLVQSLASRLSRRLYHGAAEREDLIQAGMVGLLEALQNYIPDWDKSLEDYICPRIRWAMLKHLQTLTWTSPVLRARRRKSRAAYTRLLGLLGRKPAAEGVTGALGISLLKYWRREQLARDARLQSLENLPGDPLAWCTKAIQDSLPLSLRDPAVVVEKKRCWEQVAAALATLPKRDQRLVTLHFLKEQTPDEVARRCGLADSEVHRLLSRALSRLQQALGVPPSQAQAAQEQCQAEQEVILDLVVLRKAQRGVSSAKAARTGSRQTSTLGSAPDGIIYSNRDRGVARCRRPATGHSASG